MIFRKGSLKPSDDSPFANEIFDPESTDFMFGLADHARSWVKAEYANTNYGVVNPTTLDAVSKANSLSSSSLTCAISVRCMNQYMNKRSKGDLQPVTQVS